VQVSCALNWRWDVNLLRHDAKACSFVVHGHVSFRRWSSHHVSNDMHVLVLWPVYMLVKMRIRGSMIRVALFSY